MIPSQIRYTSLFSVLFAAAIFVGSAVTALGQPGNVVSGFVSGADNKPLYDATVELLNDYGSAIKYTKTDGSGQYFFSGVGSGNFSIRVRTLEPEYEEQTQTDQIVNFSREAQDGTRTTSGFERKQMDFRMKVRRDFVGVTAAVFVQPVPDNAKKLYEQAVIDLNAKKEKEGLVGLKAAIEAFPKYFAALERYGMECLRMKQYQASATLLQLATDVNPRSYRSWYGLAYSLNSLTLLDEAIPSVKKALELYAGSTEALLLAGVIYKSKKMFPESEKALLKAKELSKDTLSQANYHLALLYGNALKRYADAARELKQFLKNEPDAKDAEQIKKLIVTFEEKAKTT